MSLVEFITQIFDFGILGQHAGCLVACPVHVGLHHSPFGVFNCFRCNIFCCPVVYHDNINPIISFDRIRQFCFFQYGRRSDNFRFVSASRNLE